MRTETKVSRSRGSLKGAWSPFVFEHHKKAVLTRRLFFLRLVRSMALACGLVTLSLGLGMAGYRFFEGWSWIDAFVNAAMILAGMGPMKELETDGGKLFAGFYALFSGLAVILIVAVVWGPLMHRLLHKFHADE